MTSDHYHPAAIMALEVSDRASDIGGSISIYTDGSLREKDDYTSWAFVVTSIQGDMLNYHGHLKGLTGLSVPGESLPTLESSTFCELLGIVWALVWVYQGLSLGTMGTNTIVKIYSDSTSALGLVQGLFVPTAFRDTAAVSQHLFATVQAAVCLAVYHVSAHSGNPWNELADGIASDQDAWWNHLSELFLRFKVDCCFIDANARVGVNSTTSRCGDQGFQQAPDSSGGLFLKFLEEVNLNAVNTLLPNLDGPEKAYTWTANNGNQHRIDYILMSDYFYKNMISVNTCLDFDIQRDKPDHYPVVGAFRALHNKDIAPLRDTIKRELTKDPHRREAFAILLRRKDFKAFIWHCALCSADMLDLSALPDRIAYLAIEFVTLSANYGRGCTSMENIIRAMGTFLQRSQKILRKHIKQARVDKINNLGKELSEQELAGQASLEWSTLHTLQRFGGKASRFCSDGLPMRIDDQGKVLDSDKAIADETLRIFGANEHAKIQKLTALCLDYNAQVNTDTPEEIKLENLSSLRTLMISLTRSKKGKAGGLDGVINELYQAAVPETAAMLLPLFLKMQMLCQEPLWAKGGLAASIYKKGPWVDLHNCRQILLGSTVLKHRHAFVRRAFVQIATQLIGECQMGGLPHRGTDLAYLSLSLFQTICEQMGLSSIILFSDLTQAFYSVILQFVSSLKGQTQDLEAILDDLKVPECLTPFLEAVVTSPKILDDFVDKHVHYMVAETFRFQIDKYDLSVPVAVSYKYLGTMVDRCASMGPEVSYRINQQNGALSTLKKHVFRNPNIEPNTKVKYAKVALGNALLRATVLLGMAAAAHGAAFIMEHPDRTAAAKQYPPRRKALGAAPGWEQKLHALVGALVGLGVAFAGALVLAAVDLPSPAQSFVKLEGKARTKAEPSKLPPLGTKVEQLRAVKAELLAAKREPSSGAVSSLLQRGLAIRREQAKKPAKVKGEWGQKSAAKVKKERSRRADGRPRKKQKVTAKRRNASRRAMERELPLSPELAELLGSDALSRPEAVRRLWSHCKERGMLNPANKREIRFDPCLQKMLGQKTAVMPQLISLLSPHFDYAGADVKAEAKHEPGAKREAKAELKREAKAEVKKQELKEELKEELKAEMAKAKAEPPGAEPGSRERPAGSAAARAPRARACSGGGALRAAEGLKAEDAGAALLEGAAREVVEEALGRSATELLSFDDSSATVRCRAPPGSFALEAVASPPPSGAPRASCSAAAAACRVEFCEAADGALAGYAEATLRGLEPAKAYSLSVRVAGASPGGGPGRGSHARPARGPAAAGGARAVDRARGAGLVRGSALPRAATCRARLRHQRQDSAVAGRGGPQGPRHHRALPAAPGAGGHRRSAAALRQLILSAAPPGPPVTGHTRISRRVLLRASLARGPRAGGSVCMLLTSSPRSFFGLTWVLARASHG
ncbi:unnamed protein product [Prorocentrum cordatum]|uniref:Uncharacterized protein n=1 Tax=Prorocentrum cordatum TaxID=2364126 RepID=A0ABN9THL0_9DINO|nr:unnamed protein product [Polarella glacialis]